MSETPTEQKPPQPKLQQKPRPKPKQFKKPEKPKSLVVCPECKGQLQFDMKRGVGICHKCGTNHVLFDIYKTMFNRSNG